MGERDLARAVAYVYLKRAATQAAETVSREWDEDQASWRNRMEGNIERWTEQHYANVERIDKLDENLAKLQERLAAATIRKIVVARAAQLLPYLGDYSTGSTGIRRTFTRVAVPGSLLAYSRSYW